jgi:CheY-like chemotaxis protein
MRDSLPEGRPLLHILLAEDNAVSRRLAARLIEKRGHAVSAVTNGHGALETLAKQRFDLVLMDVEMPEMDGLAAAAIRAREKDSGTRIPILAMTAHAMTGDCEQCLATGMDGCIPEPIRPSELFKAIEEAA